MSNLEQNINLTTYSEFKKSFNLQGEGLFKLLYDEHQQSIDVKEKFAIQNLEKIFKATFKISIESGFDKMSLRDLSKESGLSMGAIYSCINNKQDIVRMVSTLIGKCSQITQFISHQEQNSFDVLIKSIKCHLYISTLLQPWFFFLYFETRSLPIEDQQYSKNIELDAINAYQEFIDKGVEQKEFNDVDSYMLANIIVLLLEDWYLKPWKNHSMVKDNSSDEEIDEAVTQYSKSMINLAGILRPNNR